MAAANPSLTEIASERISRFALAFELDVAPGLRCKEEPRVTTKATVLPPPRLEAPMECLHERGRVTYVSQAVTSAFICESLADAVDLIGMLRVREADEFFKKKSQPRSFLREIDSALLKLGLLQE